MLTSSAMLLNHAEKQLKALGYEDGDRVNLRAFLPERGIDLGRKLAFTFPAIPQSQIEQWQEEGRGVYLVVNQGGNSDDEITDCLAVFYEHDDVDKAGLEKLQGFFPDAVFDPKPITDPTKPPKWYVPKDVQMYLWACLELPEPTMQVDTGGKSIHNYWVFDSKVKPSEWKALQCDLIAFSSGDGKLRNPSRVMRFAGCLHASGKHSRIVGGKGQRYPFSQLRALIPVAKEATTSTGQKGVTWAEFNQNWRFPIADEVPLEACLSRRNRELLANGEGSGGRNDSGFKLAADLLASTSFLMAEGQRFSGDPYQIFIDFCRRCTPGDGWGQSEWDSIWKSAQSKERAPSLTPEMIENCIRGWAWNNCPNRVGVSPDDVLKVMPSAKADVPDAPKMPEKISEEEYEGKLREAIAHYVQVVDSGDPFKYIPLRRRIAKKFEIGSGEVDKLAEDVRRQGAGQLVPLVKTVGDMFGEIEARSQGAVLPGVTCGFYDLDAMTQGFQRSDLIITAARPGCGKTSFVLNIARNISAFHKLPVVFFSMEMSREQLAYRLLASEAQIESGRLRAGRIRQSEWEPLGHAIGALSQMPIFIDDTPGLTVQEMRSKCRLLKEQQGGELGAIIVDYIQLMGGSSANRVMELGIISGALKQLARELNVPVFALSQLSRGVESRQNKRPMNSDLRESGSIEQDADLIIMLYRDELYEPDTHDRGIAEIILTKHRSGPVGTTKLLFEPEFTRFRNLARVGGDA